MTAEDSPLPPETIEGQLPVEEAESEPSEEEPPVEPPLPVRLSLPNTHCSISDETVITVDEQARVIPLAAGEALLVCEDAQISLLVDETPRITRIQASVGDCFTLLAEADALWTAEDETIAQVDENGSVLLLADGETALTLTRADGTIVESIWLVVAELPIPAATPEPTATPELTVNPEQTGMPEPSESPEPTETPVQTDTPEPALTPEPTPDPTPAVLDTPKPTEPEQTKIPPTQAPTAEPMPAPTAPPTTDEAGA